MSSNDGAEDVLEAHLACAPDGVALERLFEGDNLVGVADLGGIIGVAGIGRALGEGALDAGERAVVGGDGVVGARSHEHAGVDAGAHVVLAAEALGTEHLELEGTELRVDVEPHGLRGVEDAHLAAGLDVLGGHDGGVHDGARRRRPWCG